MLLLDIEEQTQDLSWQEKLKLINFLEKDLCRTTPSNGPSQKPGDVQTAASKLELHEAPEGYEIQAPWSFYDAYDVAANLRAWGESLPGSDYLDPEKLIYPDESTA